MRKDLLGFALLASGGVAWLAVAFTASLAEVAYCGTIAVGYAVAAWGLVGEPRRRLFAWGLSVAALGNVVPFLSYGWPTVGLDMGAAAAYAAPAGLAVAAAGALWGRPAVYRVGMAVSAFTPLYYVATGDLAGVTAWTPGNVLIAAGSVVAAVVAPRIDGDGPAPAVA